MLKPTFPLMACLLGVLLHTTIAAANDTWTWWEGETPTQTNFPDHTWFSPKPSEQHLLSNGNWLTNADPRPADAEEAYAIYEVDIPQQGQYQLWTRKFWKHGPFRYRFDDQPWQTLGPDHGLADSVTLRKHLVANWVSLGSVSLTAGKHRFELRLLAKPGENRTAAFDAFLLTQTPFFPSGKLKPGQRSGHAEPGYFAYEPAPDGFTPDALLDLRSLNENIAGEHGRVTRDGDVFKLGSGNTVRFWAVNVSDRNASQDRASVDYLARKLAKMGVNMVRYHSALFDLDGDASTLNPKRLDDLFYLISAMKKQGIYTSLSFYFPAWLPASQRFGFDGYDNIDAKKPYALIFFDAHLRTLHRGWLEQLLTTNNPYTGVTLANDPAVAMVELLNEDSLLFWTFKRELMPDAKWQQLEQWFAAHLRKRYGSLEQAITAWDGQTNERDNPAAGRMGLYNAWYMTKDGLERSGVNRKRIEDQVRFLVDQQHRFYQATTSYLHDELGYPGLIVAGNWKTADPTVLDALERYTYTAGDVIDRHGYFSGEHKGEGAAWSVRVGHTFNNRSALLHPEDLPIQINQIANYPHIISEIGWPSPNRFHAEMSLIASAYGSLQGIDGFYFFAVDNNYLRATNISKFQLATPAMVGTFPAAALAYRRGDITQGKPAIAQPITLNELYQLKGEPLAVAEAQAFDAYRQSDQDGTSKPPIDSILPLSYYVGPVLRDFNASQPIHQDINQYINLPEHTIHSNTGELTWNYKQGLATINTSRCKAVAGFFKPSQSVQLGNITITSRNEYAALFLISLDDQPLVQSNKILIQAMTENHPFGFATKNNQITNLGTFPFNIRNIEASIDITFSDARKLRVYALDENGYPRIDIAPTTSQGGNNFHLDLAPDSLYHMLLRD